MERRGDVLLIGINRAEAQNRIDPDTLLGLGKAYFDFEQDDALRVAVLFGHGSHFSCGLDAPAFAPLMLSGRFSLDAPETINPLQTTRPRLTKPLIAVARETPSTWAMSSSLRPMSGLSPRTPPAYPSMPWCSRDAR